MLDPHERTLYLDALRPPSGYKLDQAIATTFSLNLLTLLSVPLSFAKFELNKKEEILNNPVTILEALQRSSGKFHVFCQNGSIKVPNSPNSLFSYLEKMIIEGSPPNKKGVFHPKIWVLRFKHEDRKKVFYRFLSLSRNITFDKSWDTILTLEGEVRKRYFARNRPLSDFIKALPSLAKRNVSKELHERAESMAEEIRHVDFNLPPNFNDLKFWPLGISGRNRFPIRDEYWRILVVSPFLSDNILKRLGKENTSNLLISRSEELDGLGRDTLNRFEKIFVMEEVASENEETGYEVSSDAARKTQIDEESDLSDIHAKMFLAEKGWDAYLWTGSANATSAAFDNCNVEFLVELKGRKRQVGIDEFLSQNQNETSFLNLLIEYMAPDKPKKESERRMELKRRLEEIKRDLCNSDLKVKALKEERENSYALELRFPKDLKLHFESDIKAQVWPISLKSSNAQPINLSHPIPSINFKDLSLEQLTGFFAFRMEIKSLGDAANFVLNLPVTGMPKNRDDQILQVILSDKNNFIRYLLLLLFEGEYSYLASNIEEKIKGFSKGKGRWFFGEEMPLFEELVRAYSRNPDKIKRISDLIQRLSKTEEGRKLLPVEFKNIWALFEEVGRK
jgi:hypothetical protein